MHAEQHVAASGLAGFRIASRLCTGKRNAERKITMENALLVGLSSQVALKRQMDVVSNNLANMNTPGFKTGTLLFEEHLMPVAQMNELNGQDKKVSFVLDTAIYRSFDEGSFEQTGNELDVAISGDGWFVVQTPNGERYSRNGQFKLNANGELVLPSGQQVLGTGGPITFGPEETGVEIANDGTISSSAGVKGQLRIVQFENNARLKQVGDTLFSSTEPPVAADGVRTIQGAVEKSNVQPIFEMTRMIEIVRAYSNMAQSLSQTQNLRREAIEQLGTPPRA